MAEMKEALLFNADLGEGCGNDALLMPLLDQASIACGEHAGDETTMAEAVRLALEQGCAIGAHPGYADRANFGRRPLCLSESALRALLQRQLERLASCVQKAGGKLAYVKLHGALYNQTVADEELAEQVLSAIRAFDPGLACMSLPGGALARQAEAAGVPVIGEGFADRRYDGRGRLVPRQQPDALIHDPDEAVLQARRLVRDQGITSLCVHGDNPQALNFVQRLRQQLRSG